ncbi:MAG TPA: sulfite exporter TauE/SafE family protein [Alphaproteobacteria bacterium]|nr:sulfite exporter TauE/SafE family protein [Alphaproteobacteria bacterium]
MWEDVILFTAVGFAAQLIDGALGMAYGLSATTVLLSLGTAPAIASASVHTAEIFTTAASGAAHWRMGNVEPKLVVKLALPGMVGGAVGAYLLASVSGETIRPLVSAYLLCMGTWIVWKALRRSLRNTAPRHVVPLGLFGGFVDAIGGGGWGPLVASTLVGRGAVPRFAIGSVNLAEFFVTLTVSATFLATIGLELMPIIVGLVLGGVVAAPFAALATRHIPDRPLMLLVGVVIALLSLRELVRATFA